MDIWIAVDDENAEKITRAIREFGMPEDLVKKDIFLEKEKVIRMGYPPVRIELFTDASGVSFHDCYTRKETVDIEGITVNVIGLEDLKKNKRACGRPKDLEDLNHLP